MSAYLDAVERVRQQIKDKQEWHAINPEYAVRMQLQNRFKTGLEIAQYTADIMRRDMAAYDADTSKYTQSLGAWHGFIAQQTMMSVKKHQKTTDRRYIYLSGWMVAALRSQVRPAAGPVHARENVRVRPDRRDLHFPAPGGCP